MNISLTPALEAFVRQKVATGLYSDSSEVVREALRLFIREESPQASEPECLLPLAEIRSRLVAMENGIRAERVAGLSLFGSVARGEATPESDLDVLLEIDDGFSLLNQVGVQQMLEDEFGQSVSVALECALSSPMRECVLQEKIKIF